MHILLLGSGGREHALAWVLAKSSRVARISVAPGNGGTATAPKCQNVDIAADDVAALRHFALDQAVDLTVVGPEAPLAAGIVDVFQAAGLRIFGPTQAAARLESSKAFAKDFLLQHDIATGHAASFREFDAAIRYLRTLADLGGDSADALPVIKASGLAAGKGVLLPTTWDEAETALREMLLGGRFGAASETVLIEERLSGPELSVLAFCDGQNFAIMPPAQDHKRLLAGDCGPNTGGMGAFTPSPFATPGLLTHVADNVIRPTLDGMAAAGTPYVGVLYTGLMLTEDRPKVLEFNCRLGDPEAQVVLPLLASDLVDLLEACLDGALNKTSPQWRDETSATVVMASAGYPGQYAKGVEIRGVERAEAAGCLVFHAGTQRDEAGLSTAGGRVLAVTAVGPLLDETLGQVYAGVEQIEFEGAQFRADIGRGVVQAL